MKHKFRENQQSNQELVTEVEVQPKVEDIQPVFEPKQAVVSGAPMVNFRDEPGGHVISVITEGKKVNVVGQSGDWSYVEYGNKRGYVMKGYLKEV